MSELDERRALKANDAKLWTPADALRAALRDIESGAIKPHQMAIEYLQELPDGSLRHGYYLAGMNYSEHIALLRVAETVAIREWMGEP